MRLKLERISTRSTANEYGIFDEATGKCVGTISFERVPRGRSRYPTRTIRLFDSKHFNSFNTHMECAAFVKGVEAMLNYMVEVRDLEGLKSALNNMLDAKERYASCLHSPPIVERRPLNVSIGTQVIRARESQRPPRRRLFVPQRPPPLPYPEH